MTLSINDKKISDQDFSNAVIFYASDSDNKIDLKDILLSPKDLIVRGYIGQAPDGTYFGTAQGQECVDKAFMAMASAQGSALQQIKLRENPELKDKLTSIVGQVMTDGLSKNLTLKEVESLILSKVNDLKLPFAIKDIKLEMRENKDFDQFEPDEDSEYDYQSSKRKFKVR